MVSEVRKVALIINPDTDPRTAECSRCELERGLQVLKSQGYETFVATPAGPLDGIDHYAEPTLAGVRSLVSGMATDENDDIVITVLPHGWYRRSAGMLALTDGTYSDAQLHLDEIPYGRRTVVMSQCFSGNWAQVFSDDPATLFISDGSPGEVTYQGFSYAFWEPGEADWFNRFANAFAALGDLSFPQLIITPGYTSNTTQNYGHTEVIADGQGLAAVLDGLPAGGYAIVASRQALRDPENAQAFAAAATQTPHRYIISTDPTAVGVRGVYKVTPDDIVSFDIPDVKAIAASVAAFELTPGRRLDVLLARLSADDRKGWNAIAKIREMMANDLLTLEDARRAYDGLQAIKDQLTLPGMGTDIEGLLVDLADYMAFYEDVEGYLVPSSAAGTRE